MAVQIYLEELSVHQLAGKFNFIIPEIQREYVWGNNEYQILDKFFADIKDAIQEKSSYTENDAQIKMLEQTLERADDKDKDSIRNIIDTYLSKKDLNIGFLYSYRPYYNYVDLINDVYLIDGQQRLTTLFLTLFYFSLKESGNYEDFRNLFRFEAKTEKIGFDYRVRTLTHNFLFDLLSNCKESADLENLSNQNWFLSDYSNDVTVKAMIGTLNKLEEHFKTDVTKYYQFIKKQIRFWHFKTDETSQGEELYITMNSRGQQLAENETVRAKLFENEKVKINQLEWGAKWEEWQDFFWKNKTDGGSADIGFNQFLRWVNIIETFSIKSFKPSEAEKEFKVLFTENQVLDYVSLFEIEPYFNALKLLKEYRNEGFFASEFFDKNFKMEWLKGDINQIDLIKLFPALLYLKFKATKEYLNRFIRYFSNIIKDPTINKNPDTYIIESIKLTNSFLDEGFDDICNLTNFKSRFPSLIPGEEVCKLNLYKKQRNDQDRINLETAFWTAEDFRFSNGKIGHLLQMSFLARTNEFFYFNYSFNYESIIDIDINRFQSVFKSYSELINNENEMWGELIITDVYFESFDRVYALGNWHLNNGFLNFVLEREFNNFQTLELFLISREKHFIRKYISESELKKESDPKKQLYIYYILHKRLLNKWNWSKWNFGIYKYVIYSSTFTLFRNNFIYQFYNSQLRYNIGYTIHSGVWLQDNADDSRNYLSELINWSSI